ncbi:hypothetical protein B0H13DRAFT_1861652 [Mycena leptocephala]|nr:hypothetical protein B0H13DRAFT_1861652 [Mycena leptocephala]
MVVVEGDSRPLRAPRGCGSARRSAIKRRVGWWCTVIGPGRRQEVAGRRGGKGPLRQRVRQVNGAENGCSWAINSRIGCWRAGASSGSRWWLQEYKCPAGLEKRQERPGMVVDRRAEPPKGRNGPGVQGASRPETRAPGNNRHKQTCSLPNPPIFSFYSPQIQRLGRKGQEETAILGSRGARQDQHRYAPTGGGEQRAAGRTREITQTTSLDSERGGVREEESKSCAFSGAHVFNVAVGGYCCADHRVAEAVARLRNYRDAGSNLCSADSKADRGVNGYGLGTGTDQP